MVRSATVDVADLLKDLLEVSGQIEAAILLQREGTVLSCTIDDDGRATDLEAATRGLIEAAGEAPGGRSESLVQLQVLIGDGCVFVVQDEDRIAGCVTGMNATPGLVFYDLKTVLRRYAGDDATPSPQAWTGAEEPSSGEAS